MDSEILTYELWGGVRTETPSITEWDSMDRQEFESSDVCYRDWRHRTVIFSLCR